MLKVLFTLEEGKISILLVCISSSIFLKKDKYPIQSNEACQKVFIFNQMLSNKKTHK